MSIHACGISIASASIYEMMGQTRKAMETLTKLPKVAQSKSEIIRREAVLAQRLGDRQAMLAHLRELVAAEPSENNLAAFADAQIGAGQSGAAAATLETLLAIHGLPAERRASYLARLGNLESSRGNTKRAQSLFVEAYHLSPAHPPEWLAQAAESATQAKDWQGAAQWYRMLTENEQIPRKTRAGYDARLGFVLANLARDQEALAAYDAAIQLGGATPSLHENRGIVLMRLGRAAGAASEFRAAYDAHPRADSCFVPGVCPAGGTSTGTRDRFSAAGAGRPAGVCRRRRDNRPVLRWAMHTPTRNSMIRPQVASRERLEYYRAQPPIAAVASVMKLRRSNEHRRNNPTVSARAGPGAALGQNRAAPRIRSGRRRCTRLPYGLAELALVGAVLLSSMAGIRSVGAAQTPSAGSTEETSAAFSNLEKLRLTLALARSYRLTEQPQKALDILAPLSAGPWPSAAIEAEYHDELHGMRRPWAGRMRREGSWKGLLRSIRQPKGGSALASWRSV